MNALGLTMIMKMGCFCTRERVNVNGFRYSVLERIGDGGFSKVDLVEGNKRRYALKRITCHSIQDQQKVQKEIDYLARLSHPNIMELIDSVFIGSADIVINATSEALIILPYYPRGTLHDYLLVRARDKHYLGVPEVFRIFCGICAAVRYLHEQRPKALAHRDLKTSNVCFTDDYTPVLIDLGSMTEARIEVCGASDAQRLQDAAAEHCSAPYRAPELFTVESYCVVDERTDIWSLGCVLYALCYFISPFDAVYMRGDSVALAVLSGGVNFPAESLYPEPLHDLIMYMLNTNPAERPFIQNVMEKTDVVRNEVGNVV